MSQKTTIQRVFEVISNANQKHGRLQGIIESPRRHAEKGIERKDQDDAFRRLAKAPKEKETAFF